MGSSGVGLGASRVIGPSSSQNAIPASQQQHLRVKKSIPEGLVMSMIESHAQSPRKSFIVEHTRIEVLQMATETACAQRRHVDPKHFDGNVHANKNPLQRRDGILYSFLRKVKLHDVAKQHSCRVLTTQDDPIPISQGLQSVVSGGGLKAAAECRSVNSLI